MRLPRFLSAATAIALGLSVPAQGASLITKIYEASGRDSFIVSDPSLNNSGTAAFVVGNTSLNRKSILTGSGGATTTIATTDGPLSFFNRATINNSGTVAFVANHDAGGSGVYTGSGGALTTVASTDGTSRLFHTAAISDSGAVTYSANSAADGTGIYTRSGDVTTKVTSAPIGGFIPFGINASGTVAHETYPRPNEVGLVTNVGGTTTTIASTDGPIGGFNNLDGFAINASGTVAFAASLDGGGGRIYTGSGGELTTIIANGGPFKSVIRPAINASGTVAFMGINGLATALYTTDGTDITRVIGVGDVLDGSMISSLDFSSTGLNDLGSLAFRAGLSDGRQGIYRIDAATVPEPSSLLVLGVGLAGCFAVARRRAGATRQG